MKAGLRMGSMRRGNGLLFLVLGAVLGVSLGLLIGYVIAPVQWVDQPPANLAPQYQVPYLAFVADEFVRTGDLKLAQDRLGITTGDWNGAQAAEQLNAVAGSLPPVQAADVKQLAGALGSAASPSNPPPATGLPSALIGQLLPICGVAVLALALISGGWYLLTRRRTALETEFGAEGYVPGTLSASAITLGPQEDENGLVPLAQFISTYTFGDDMYDDSFTIDTGAGEFLGECGVGLSETIGVGDPKKVTAFEVWLFDKNDIRTVTKVLMSEHAYNDDALRAKLLPKGEAVLAQVGDTITLETASLMVMARVADIEYGAGALPPQSFFNKVVLELSAWAKHGEMQVQEPVEEG